MLQLLVRSTLAPALAAGLLAVTLPPGRGAAGGKAAKPAAKAEHVHGSLLRQAEGEPWKLVKEGDSVPAGSALVALPRAELVSPNGAVAVGMLADIGHRGPFPVLESDATLNASPDFDLDVTLD